jgi:hypothetical protein
MVDSYYSVRVILDNPDISRIHFGQIGTAYMQGPWRSMLGQVIRAVMQIFWKEGSI